MHMEVWDAFLKIQVIKETWFKEGFSRTVVGPVVGLTGSEYGWKELSNF